MRLSAQEIEDLKNDGGGVPSYRPPPKPMPIPPPKPNEELNALRSIVTKLDALIEKPDTLTISPPSVTVSPAPVTVQTNHPVKKWKFEVLKINDSRMEITASAME